MLERICLGWDSWGGTLGWDSWVTGWDWGESEGVEGARKRGSEGARERCCKAARLTRREYDQMESPDKPDDHDRM